MKGYTEHRGVQSRLVFDDSSGAFVQRAMRHEFGSTGAAPSTPEAELIVLPAQSAGGKRKRVPPEAARANTSELIKRAG